MKLFVFFMFFALLLNFSVCADDSIAGFVYLGTHTYSCGGQTHTVKEYRHITTTMEFVLLPGNSEIKPFLMSKYEVPQAVWKSVMGTNPSHFEGANRPVEQVSWIDCESFCEKTGLSLPTSEQWEYAYRAGTSTLYYWGDEPSRDYMWYSDLEPSFNRDGSSKPIGKKKPNAFGLYDMSGNVWEWCKDEYRIPKWRAEEKRETPGVYYNYRGGSFFDPAENAATDYIYGDHLEYSNADLGFRVCKSLHK